MQKSRRTMGQVANKYTRLTPGQALGALLLAGCPGSAVRMVAAQSAVETAGWAAMRNWNLGNVTPSAAQVAAGIAWMTQNVPNMKYIAYANPVAGAQGMMGWIRGHGLLPYAEQGDLAGYVQQLQNGCYLGCVGNTDPSNGKAITTQDYANYSSGISAWMSKLAGVTPTAPPMPLDWGDVALGAAGLAAAGIALVTYARPDWIEKAVRSI